MNILIQSRCHSLHDDNINGIHHLIEYGLTEYVTSCKTSYRSTIDHWVEPHGEGGKLNKLFLDKIIYLCTTQHLCKIRTMHDTIIASHERSFSIRSVSPDHATNVSPTTLLTIFSSRSSVCYLADHKTIQSPPKAMASKILPKPIVICGPSGVGKGTLIEMLFKRFPNDQFGFSVSHTTRKPREGEVDGKHYHFTSVEKVKHEIAEGKFIEYAEVHGNYYGTSVAAVESVQKENRICILDIDIQGVKEVKKSSLEPLYFFITPPSLGELEKRLRGRGTETEESIKKRLANSKQEMDYGHEAGNFDRIFVNADLNSTFEELAACIKENYPQLDEVAPDDEQKNCTSSCVVS